MRPSPTGEVGRARPSPKSRKRVTSAFSAPDIASIQPPSRCKRRARTDPEPGEDLAHMRLDGPLSNAELSRNQFVREPERGKLGNFMLTARELHLSSLDLHGPG